MPSTPPDKTSIFQRFSETRLVVECILALIFLLLASSSPFFRNESWLKVLGPAITISLLSFCWLISRLYVAWMAPFRRVPGLKTSQLVLGLLRGWPNDPHKTDDPDRRAVVLLIIDPAKAEVTASVKKNLQDHRIDVQVFDVSESEKTLSDKLGAADAVYLQRTAEIIDRSWIYSTVLRWSESQLHQPVVVDDLAPGASNWIFTSLNESGAGAGLLVRAVERGRLMHAQANFNRVIVAVVIILTVSASLLFASILFRRSPLRDPDCCLQHPSEPFTASAANDLSTMLGKARTQIELCAGANGESTAKGCSDNPPLIHAVTKALAQALQVAKLSTTERKCFGSDPSPRITVWRRREFMHRSIVFTGAASEDPQPHAYVDDVKPIPTIVGGAMRVKGFVLWRKDCTTSTPAAWMPDRSAIGYCDGKDVITVPSLGLKIEYRNDGGNDDQRTALLCYGNARGLDGVCVSVAKDIGQLELIPARHELVSIVALIEGLPTDWLFGQDAEDAARKEIADHPIK
jgi:hypothetical protein